MQKRKRHPFLSFPCLISALCRQRKVPTYNNDKYTDFRTGLDLKHYLKKMDVADAIPIQVAMPTPTHSEHTETLPLSSKLQKNRQDRNQPHQLLNLKEAPLPRQQLKVVLLQHQLPQ
ncbi:hypothetical protein V6N11_056046 [Hibiscus sabdariffa]|uniref:Uncharacterized protein n=1 Tax=Hibiscus sabdariffa TaxID=183260 RepID=A0ABR2T2P3_9ROSI